VFRLTGGFREGEASSRKTFQVEGGMTAYQCASLYLHRLISKNRVVKNSATAIKLT
jgi:hypothetical protein